MKRAPGAVTRVERENRASTNQTGRDKDGGPVRGTAMRLMIGAWNNCTLRKICTETGKGCYGLN